MRKVILKSIEIYGFKGIASAKMEFESGANEISAQNGSGKTSLKNAYEWLLCQNVQEIYPKFNNEELHNISRTSVEAVFDIDGNEYTLKRESESKFSSNDETGTYTKTKNVGHYYIDGFEQKQTDYQKKIGELFANSSFENITLLTDKEFLNTDCTKWKWTDRRKLLFDMANVKDVISELSNSSKYELLKPYIDKGFSTTDIKSILEKEKKTLKASQEKNNILIEQKQTEISYIPEIDYDKTIRLIEEKRTELDDLIKNGSITEEQKKIQQTNKEISEILTQTSSIRIEDANKLAKLRKESVEIYNKCQASKSEYNKLYFDRNSLIAENKQNATIKNATKICPSCGQALPKEKLDELKHKFEKQISDNKLKIAEMEKLMVIPKETYEKNKEKYEVLVSEINKFKPDDRIGKLEEKLEVLKLSLQGAKVDTSNDLLLEEKTRLRSEISSLEDDIRNKKIVDDAKNMINSWKDCNLKIASEIRDVDIKLLKLTKFVKEQAEKTTKTINNMFSDGVSWSLFEVSYNGELSEKCELMYNGRLYSSLSTGEKAFVNLKCVETLQNKFETNIPIWIDNGESNTIDFNTDRQTIKLIVAEGVDIKNIIKIKKEK